MTEQLHAPFVLLRATDPTRGEVVNAGVVLFLPDRAVVGISDDAGRLKTIHPDFAAVNLARWAEQLEASLAESWGKLRDMQQRIAMLPLYTAPFTADQQPGMATLQDTAEATLEQLLTWLVRPRKATIKSPRSRAAKLTKLHVEIRDWLKAAKAFSTHIEDLSKHRVVANYPVDPSNDLYADLALMNGQLHVMEIMDLRGVDRLTGGMRGEAAVKGITLDEAKGQANGIAIVAASDYAAARPAISMIGRYASDLFDLGQMSERDRLASFVGKALKRDDLISQAIPLA